MAVGRNLMGGGVTRATRVRRTGIALVHEGELVLPAPGSEAAAGVVGEDDRAVVNYHFPVEIEIRGGRDDGSTADPRASVEQALASLAQGIDNLA